MFFKGTAHRTAREMAEMIDAVGGQLNAFTTREYTCFYAKTLDCHLKLAMELLADMYCASALDEGELAKEKGVVLEEIKAYEDAPDDLVHDLLAAALWPDHPLGRPVLGMPATVARLTGADLHHYLASHYRTGNTVLAVAGCFNFDEVCRLTERYLANLPIGMAPNPTTSPVAAGKRLVKRKDIEQVHLCIGGRGVERRSPDKFAVFVMDSILGGSVSSRLFQTLREERGLVYATGSTHSAFRDGGLFAIYAGTAPDRIAEVVQLILAELKRLVTESVSVAELARAKEQIRGSYLLGLESTSTRMTRLGKAELFYDSILTPQEILARVDCVNADDVMRVARSIFTYGALPAAAIAPFRTKLELDRLLGEGIAS